MKFKIGRRLLGLGGTCAAIVFTGYARGASEPSPAPSAKLSAPSTATASAPALTRAVELEKIAAARQYVAHPPTPPDGKIAEPKITSPEFEMEDPPPASRIETKPAAPSASYVWVAGHYMPVKGEWRWVRGEWALPAMPISVWIQARYDAKEKKWSPGYWQPDLPVPTQAEPSAKGGAPAAKAGY